MEASCAAEVKLGVKWVLPQNVEPIPDERSGAKAKKIKEAHNALLREDKKKKN